MRIDQGTLIVVLEKGDCVHVWEPIHPLTCFVLVSERKLCGGTETQKNNTVREN